MGGALALALAVCCRGSNPRNPTILCKNATHTEDVVWTPGRETGAGLGNFLSFVWDDDRESAPPPHLVWRLMLNCDDRS